MFIEFQFQYGEFVQLKTDEEKKKRVVTAIVIKGKNYLEYQLACGLESSGHAETEIEKYTPAENHPAGFKA
jgi:hypothetical protein